MAFKEEPVDIDKVIIQEEFSYGDHELQRMTVYHHFGKEHFQKGGLFIIYIHGGAWRDPSTTDKSFLPTIRQLFSNPSHHDLVNDRISGFASVSYRLSSHPRHPQDPGTPATELRDAKHPDHLQDIISSISFLQERYGFGSRYLLIGHSCGATLAFQTLLRNDLSIPLSIPFQNPEIIVGVAGIYDLRLLRDNNSHPAYQEFIASAFGKDEKAWDQASPATHNIVSAWPEAKIVVLASSSGDELVDGAQVECMEPQLSGLRGKAAVLVLKNFLGMSHDDIWEKGVGLAAVIGETLKVWEKDDKASGLAALKGERA